jgi:hypothetical protein
MQRKIAEQINELKAKSGFHPLFEEGSVVALIPKDLTAPNPPIENMIKGTWIFNP